MNNTKIIWTLRNGTKAPQEFSTFPHAFRTMHNIVKSNPDKINDLMALRKSLTIVGPPNFKGERTTYNYFTACEMAKDTDLLSTDGDYINNKVFKNKR